jgi:hypothetical protein
MFLLLAESYWLVQGFFCPRALTKSMSDAEQNCRVLPFFDGSLAEMLQFSLNLFPANLSYSTSIATHLDED